MNIWRVEYHTDSADGAWIVPAVKPSAAIRKALAKDGEVTGRSKRIEILAELLHKNVTWEQYKKLKDTGAG